MNDAEPMINKRNVARLVLRSDDALGPVMRSVSTLFARLGFVSGVGWARFAVIFRRFDRRDSISRLSAPASFLRRAKWHFSSCGLAAMIPLILQFSGET